MRQSTRGSIDLYVTNDPVAIGIASTGAAKLDAAAETAMGLLRQILQEQRVHRSLETDMKFGNIPLGHSHDPHLGKPQQPEQPSNIGLIARETIERLGDNDIARAGARRLQQGLISGPKGLAPLSARSMNTSLSDQPSRVISSLQMRIWSSTDASR